MRSTILVARDILGKFLVMRQPSGALLSCKISEVEAYDGFDDKASHASRGRTARNAPMFEAGGIWYVYFVYGMYEMLNIVTGPKEYPAAVLIRGVEGIDGPGKLTRKYAITRAYNGKPAVHASGLWMEDRGIDVPKSQIQKSPRIGVGYAGTEWAGKPYRFYLKNHVLKGTMWNDRRGRIVA